MQINVNLRLGLMGSDGTVVNQVDRNGKDVVGTVEKALPDWSQGSA